MSCRLAAALCALLSCCAARADDTDPSLVIDKYVQHFTVNTDGSYLLTVDQVKRIAQPRAIAAHSQYYISYNRTLDQVGAIDAYTRKPDGRRVPVLPEHIKDQQEAASSDAPMFQDTRLKIIIFPDVETGDQLVVHYTLKRLRALFPGQFEDLTSSEFYDNRQFFLIYDMPASMPLHADAAGFEPVAIAGAPGRRRYQWHYLSGPNPRIEEASVSYLDYGKRLAVSTFPDYAAFARAYTERAGGQRASGAAIAALAARLTAALPEPRAKALALSDWVRRHIRYVAVYVGPGGVVPHPAATVLANRYGDCKDHAALLEALLRAAGIASSAVLVNNGSAYRLPRVPTLGIFNHVITYVPSLDLYLDSTAESIEAGYLPSAVMDKPVLLAVTGRIARTPAAQLNRQRTAIWFGLQADGGATFKVSKTTEGALAEPYRQAVRDTKPADRDLFVRQILQGLGQQGKGTFDPGHVDGKGGRYILGMQGSSDHVASLPGPFGMATSYNFWGGLDEALSEFGQRKERTQDFICPAIDAEDELALALPEGVKVIALPKPLMLEDPHLRYRSQYLQRDNAVIVRRSLVFRHPTLVCSAADYRRLQPLLERMLRDLKSQVIIGAP
jgi:transglutaminase-like putative cysteine protease